MPKVLKASLDGSHPLNVWDCSSLEIKNLSDNYCVNTMMFSYLSACLLRSFKRLDM